MKFLLTLLVATAAPALVFAQAAAPAQKSKPAARPAAKTTPQKAGARLSPRARKAVEEATPIEDEPGVELTDADRAVARQVFVGTIPCELGASVSLTPLKREGYFLVTTKGHRFRMHPVESRTGAIRLEDSKRGAMWLQLGNKSMLMSQKLGQRLADECQSPQQLTYADELRRNPLPSILEAPPVVPVVPVVPAQVPPPTASIPAAAAGEATPVVVPAANPADAGTAPASTTPAATVSPPAAAPPAEPPGALN